jgi:hypothetical protein
MSGRRVRMRRLYPRDYSFELPLSPINGLYRLYDLMFSTFAGLLPTVTLLIGLSSFVSLYFFPVAYYYATYICAQKYWNDVKILR